MQRRLLSLVLLTSLALLPGTPSAAPPLQESASVLVLPFISDSREQLRETVVTVTNGSDRAYILLLTVVFGENWNAVHIECLVTASETTRIRMESGIGASGIHLECTDPDSGDSEDLFQVVGTAQGVILAAVIDPATREVVNDDVLFGDSTVVELGREDGDGNSYSLPAHPIRAGIEMVAGEPVYRFDGLSLEPPPATIFTNFRAPTKAVQDPGDGLTGELLLFALDGTVNEGAGAPNVTMDVVFYDDDETPTSAHYMFSCFDVVDLIDISPRFRRDFLGSEGGHLYLTVIDADQPPDSGHDEVHGNGNAIRVVPVIGWLIQKQNSAFFGKRSYARRMLRGGLPADRDGTDVPVIDATN